MPGYATSNINGTASSHNGKAVSSTSDCCGCGGGPGGPWGPWDDDPNGEGVYLTTTPCPGGEPPSARVIVFVPAGTPQPQFNCTTVRVENTCVSVGNTSAVTTYRDGDIVVGADLSGDRGRSCCECVPTCGTQTIEYYRGYDFCDSHDRVYKQCCCGPVKNYSVVIRMYRQEPGLHLDGQGNRVWHTNIENTTTKYDWVYEGDRRTSCKGVVLFHGSYYGQPDVNTETPTDCPQWSVCAPWGVGFTPDVSGGGGFNGLECSTRSTTLGTHNRCTTEVWGDHDCKEHTGYVITICKEDQSSNLPHPAPDFVFTYQFRSSLESPDGGCSGGCQGGSNAPVPRPVRGRTAADIIGGFA